VLLGLKRIDDALASYDAAIALRPDHAGAHWNRGLARLLNGQYESGWQDYEWRFDVMDLGYRRPNVNAPIWQDEELAGRHLLIFCEQGLGDAIQFTRYLPLVTELGAQVTLLAPAKLARLLQPVTNGIHVVSALRGNETFDSQCALLDLPLRFYNKFPSLANRVPYLSADKHLVDLWKERIGENAFKIGIAWQGNPKFRDDEGRSIPLERFDSLSRVSGVRLISVQKLDGLSQLARLPGGAGVETLGDFDAGPDAFIDTAAIMENLDLIITSDTSIAHLAGALGRPTWIALKYLPDWRWLLDRNDSPWYPTARLFRQTERNNWTSVFAKIESELRSVLAREVAPV
jgi:hypothetical protein